MYPTLYHAALDWFGWELQVLKLVNTFGFLVALGFLGAARCLASELERKHAAGKLLPTRRRVQPERAATSLDLALSGVLAFVVGFKLFGVALGEVTLQGGVDTQRYLFSTRGSLAAGLVSGIGWVLYQLFVARRHASRASAAVPEEATTGDVAPREHTLGITGAAALGSLIGAKLFHLLEQPRSILELIRHPSIEALFSGLTIYGGLIVGALSVYWYCRRHGLAFAHVADAAAPGLMLGYGIGRLGCQLAGDGDWGIASSGAPGGPSGLLSWVPSWFWAYDFPNNVLGSGVPMASGGYAGYGTHLVPYVYPTPLYEALAALGCFAALWLLRKRIERPLLMFASYLVLNGVERFWIERIRVNSTYELFGHAVTQAQLISVLVLVGGLALAYRQLRQPLAPPLAAPHLPPATE
jgi:phosphatidylglycerol:prolipoprotein diacylglycerol transferase